MIYLDHAATTPVDSRVADVMAASLRRGDGNPSAAHAVGRAARAAVEAARCEVAALIGAAPGQIVFTSGATEADNLAVLGVMRFAGESSRHLVTSKIEHRAVLDPARRLEAEGCRVSYVSSGLDGRILPTDVSAALRPDTRLLSVMAVNNETGVVQDVAAIAAAGRERGALVHTDAAQALGRIRFDVNRLGLDLVSLSAHKMGGPQGVGALWIGPRAEQALRPLLHGGGQERGLRPGTLPVHQLLGWGEACRIARTEFDATVARLRALTERLAAGLLALPGVRLNGAADHRAPHILNLAFAGVDGESLHASLDGLAVSGGSACGAERAEPSYVLRALGRDDAQAEASIRFSVGGLTSEKDIDMAIKIVEKAIFRLRRIAPA
jgi:cysteine desulfurase